MLSINLRGVSTKLNKYIIFTMQTYKEHIQSDIVVIYHGQQLTHCEDEVKSFVKSTSCPRVASYSPFDPIITPHELGHDCCSNCFPCANAMWMNV